MLVAKIMLIPESPMEGVGGKRQLAAAVSKLTL